MYSQRSEILSHPFPAKFGLNYFTELDRKSPKNSGYVDNVRRNTEKYRTKIKIRSSKSIAAAFDNSSVILGVSRYIVNLLVIFRCFHSFGSKFLPGQITRYFRKVKMCEPYNFWALIVLSETIECIVLTITLSYHSRQHEIVSWCWKRGNTWDRDES